MKALKYFLLSILFVSTGVIAQQGEESERELGHTNNSKFKQLYDEFSTPNMFRTASGAPGPAYYQQQADYVMEIEVDDENQKLFGFETITYTNNSPDELNYLWVQLDQNKRANDSKSPLINATSIKEVQEVSSFAKTYLKKSFDGGFNIEEVKDQKGNPLEIMINRTMMRVNLPIKLKSGDQFAFSIKWWYNINNVAINGGRSGLEEFEDGNRAYTLAQFYPRMAVYNDVEGWQHSQFWGTDEFALPFGNFKVNITVPDDFILDGTGELKNRDDIFTKVMLERYQQAKRSFDKPVVIVTENEAIQKSKGKSKGKKTWILHANNVRDFGFATSRKYIWDMMAVKIGGKDVMAVSLYPKEGNPLWEEWSTKTVASTLKSYSRMTFDYPYHKAISVSANRLGMEYPMICFNRGRPDSNGSYTDRVKLGLISLVVHEVGHNFFPMIVNSDERQWTWMDEGLNVFIQIVAEKDFAESYPEALEPNYKEYPTRRGQPKQIVPYMGGDQDFIMPIMTKGLNTYQFGNNAYAKPATALNILRETVMGRELFDFAFKEYANRWKFKHPTPEDFFRTMEDASAFDLDWFWRGWFYTTDYTDIGVKEVKKYYISNEPNQQMRNYVEKRGIDINDLPSYVYLVEEGSDDFKESLREKTTLENSPTLNEYLMDNFTPEEQKNIETPNYFYKITFNKPGGLVMPIIVEYEYADSTKERVTYPAQIWRYNDNEVSKAIAATSELVKITVDPDKETADIDTSNNSWPKEIKQSKFDQFKSENKN